MDNGTNTKISDSGYSNSTSSKSGSNSSRDGSRPCIGPNNQSNETEINRNNKEKEHKKKKIKQQGNCSTTNVTNLESTNTDDSLLKLTEANINESSTMGKITTIIDNNREINEENLASNKNLTSDTSNEDEFQFCSWSEKLDAIQLENKINQMELSTINIKCCDDNIKLSSYQPENGFCCIISMYDGVVLYTTPSLTTILGFPKDMWLGRSFIDFIHPKDKDTFTRYITTYGITLSLIDNNNKKKCKALNNCLYVCLRKYKGYNSSGFSIADKPVCYQAFHLTVTFHHMTNDYDNNSLEIPSDNANTEMILALIAVPVYTSYKVPEEKLRSEKFGMKHTASCIFSHVDPDVVNNFGYLPQDMLGKSIFDFYHPEDMIFLKEVYETVIKMCQIAGSVFRSKPYRFAVQNGGFVMIETEWSSFVNPWSRRLEFVIGLHRVIQGPKNPNIFEQKQNDETILISEEVLKESRNIQDEIKLLLNQELTIPDDIIKHDMSKRCQHFANFVEYLMDGVNKTNLEKKLQKADTSISVSSKNKERESVMLGEISPHHEYYDSKSSSVTPISYNQLNYNENILRFLQSKPKTAVSSDESGDRLLSISNPENKVPPNTIQCCENNTKCSSPLENSGDSGSGSGGNLSSFNNNNQNMDNLIDTNPSCSTSIRNNSLESLQLTEAVLLKHNEDMKKIMIKRYKEQRCSNKDKEHKKLHHKSDKILNSGELKNAGNNQTQTLGHGVKRSVSNSWEEDIHKISKQNHQIINENNLQSEKNNKKLELDKNKIKGFKNENQNLWPPPFSSISLSPISNNNNNNNQPPIMNNSTMYPLYFIPPTAQQQQQQLPPSTHSYYQIPYISGMVYGSPQLLYSRLPIFSIPISTPTTVPSSKNSNEFVNCFNNININSNNELKPNQQIYDSQFHLEANSVNAEPPGSIVGSIASITSNVKTMSECSRKDLQSVCSTNSPLDCPSDGETHMENYQRKNNNNNQINDKIDDQSTSNLNEGESCFSSTYSSVLNPSSISTEQLSVISENYKVRKDFSIKKKDPPWLENTSSDIIYRYQMPENDLESVLQSDSNKLKQINQSLLINDQLQQLYGETTDELSTKFSFEEGILSTSSSSGDEKCLRPCTNHKKKRKAHSSSIMHMVFEDQMPLPSSSDKSE